MLYGRGCPYEARRIVTTTGQTKQHVVSLRDEARRFLISLVLLRTSTVLYSYLHRYSVLVRDALISTHSVQYAKTVLVLLHPYDGRAMEAQAARGRGHTVLVLYGHGVPYAGFFKCTWFFKPAAVLLRDESLRFPWVISVLAAPYPPYSCVR